MNKSITTRREWNLAPYHQLEVAEVTTDIPESKVDDEEFISLVHLQQLVQVELQYQNYINLLEKVEEFKNDTQAKISYLEQLRSEYSTKYIEYLAKEN